MIALNFINLGAFEVSSPVNSSKKKWLKETTERGAKAYILKKEKGRKTHPIYGFCQQYTCGYLFF